MSQLARDGSWPTGGGGGDGRSGKGTRPRAPARPPQRTAAPTHLGSSRDMKTVQRVQAQGVATADWERRKWHDGDRRPRRRRDETQCQSTVRHHECAATASSEQLGATRQWRDWQATATGWRAMASDGEPVATTCNDNRRCAIANAQKQRTHRDIRQLAVILAMLQGWNSKHG